MIRYQVVLYCVFAFLPVAIVFIVHRASLHHRRLGVIGHLVLILYYSCSYAYVYIEEFHMNLSRLSGCKFLRYANSDNI